VTFLTGNLSPADLFDFSKAKNVGVVLWMDRAAYQKFYADRDKP